MKSVRSLQHAWGLLFLRVSASALLFFGHGLDKLLNLTERAGSFPDPIGIGAVPSLFVAVFAEIVCTLFVAAGLVTRLATLPILATLLVAAVVVHGDDPFGKRELALLYAVPFLTVLVMGPGVLALDTFRKHRRGAAVRAKLHNA